MQHETTRSELDRAQDDREVDAVADNAELEDELLIEEISIDGMCGVY
ncbi:MAG: mycofactocin precursor [Ilumatobacter sp.]|nr:mycofactocin precursor [Ilumatobacter sp.]